MGRLLASLYGSTALGAIALWCALEAHADTIIDGSIDVRAVAADAQPSFLNGGLGKLRFDEQHDGLRFDNARLGLTTDLTDTARAHLEVVSYADDDRSAMDATEAYLDLRPFPRHLWRSRWRIGAFYAPISLENRLQGWNSAYSLSSSAINTWIAEELRTIGVEYTLDWLGQQHGSNWNLSLVSAAYSWNEAAGYLIALRGWAIHDRQTTLFGNVGKPFGGPSGGIREFYAYTDQKVGYYAGASADYRGTLQLRALHYDNRADPATYTKAIDDNAWRTRFDSAGARWSVATHWTLITQWMNGSTASGPTNAFDDWHFDAAFLLANWRSGAESASVRYDVFEMQQIISSDVFVNSDHGHAWTLAYQHDVNRHFTLALEALQIDSRLAARVSMGTPPGAVERELQLAARFEF